MRTTTQTVIVCAGEVLAEVYLTAVPDRLDDIELGDKTYRVKSRKLVLKEQFEGTKSVGFKQTYVLTVDWTGRVETVEDLRC